MNAQQLIAEILDHARGMWRYRWQFVIVAWCVAIPGWAFIYNMSDIYEASAKVSVDTSNLLPELTRGLTASEDLMDEVGLISKALLTRPNLEAVARETDLDLRAETPQQMESLISGLQRRVKINAARDNIFSISFEDRSRDMATNVVSALLNAFVESSLGAQGEDADMTERALRLEIDDHEERLLKAEAELARFKTRNLGYMPDDGKDYYERLQTAIMGVADVEQKIRLLRQRRTEIIRQLEGEEPVFGLMQSTPAQAVAACSKAGSISQLEGQLSALQVDFTDKHPRIVMLKDTIAQLQAQCESELAESGSLMAASMPEADSLDTNPVYQSLRLQLSNADVDLAALNETHNSRRQEVARLRDDVDQIATVETELKKLNRDYEVIETRHQELLARWEKLQSKKRLDPVTDKVRFNILEPPFSAAAPVAPNRPMLLGFVLFFAFGTGGAAAFGLNQLKPVFYNSRTLRSAVGLPVLGSVSRIMSTSQMAARRRKTAAWLTANVALFFAGGLAIAMEDQIRELMRVLTGGAV